jgi:septum formation protein
LDNELKNLILASASKSRSQMLSNAGVEFKVQISSVDEAKVKGSYKPGSAGDLALKLAVLKANNVSNKSKDALVVGADQVLECEGVLYDKPINFAAASSHLRALQGKQHRLISSVCVACNNEILWDFTDSVNLTMRNLSDEFIQSYLAKSGPDILSTVGGYQLEGIGAQLFSRLEGDFFTVLGLPLLPLLDFLRKEKILNT